MSNPFSHMNREQKRQFDALPVEQKAQVVQAAVLDEAKKTMANQISDAMIRGVRVAREEIYKEHVSAIDQEGISEELRQMRIENLLSFLRIEHLKHLQRSRGSQA